METNKGYVLTYDRASLPKGMTMKDVMNFIKNENKVYYDSSLNTEVADAKPKVIHLGGDKGKYLLNVEFIDLSPYKN